jgi:Major Facilitator Superfamily
MVARFVQGLGGALTSAVILGMIVTMFTEPRERTRAISLYSFVAASGASIGLLAGGVLTEALNWHWIFFVNVPIGIVTAVLALRLIQDDRGLGLGRGADIVGAALVTGALMLGVLTIIRTSVVGWTSIETVAGAAATAIAFVAFVVRETRTANPLLPLRIFRSRAVTGANAVMFLLVAGFFGTFFIGSLYLERVLGFDALGIGLGFLPVSLGIGLMSVAFAEPLITRFGQRSVLRAGLGLVLLAMLWFARLPAGASYLPDVAPALTLIGIGAGIGFPSIVGLAMSGATSADAGLASGLVNTTRMVGGSLGLAAMASIATTRGAALVAAGADGATALSGGSQLALLFAAGLIVAAIAVSLTVLRPDRVEIAEAADDKGADVEVILDAA